MFCYVIKGLCMEKYAKFINILKILDEQKKGDNPSVTNEEISQKYIDGEYRIVTEQARYPFSSLATLFDRNKLQPEYQRNFIWDKIRKSKLIESIIINIPIPPIFLYEIEFAKYEIMDGLQRVSTIIDFLEDKFELEGLEIWKELNGKVYSSLPETIQDGIKRRYLSAVILLKESSKEKNQEDEMKRFVFDRLNSGGVKLEPQEIRNALYSGHFNTLLSQLSQKVDVEDWSVVNDDFIRSHPINKQLFLMWKGFPSFNIDRMYGQELVLRFFAYMAACKNNISKGTKYILDTYAREAVAYTKQDTDLLEEVFGKTIGFVLDVFGDNAFCSSDGKVAEKQIFDAIMLASVYKLLENNWSYKKIYIGADKNLLIEQRKEDVFNGKYTSISATNKKIELIKDLLMQKGIFDE